MARILQLSDIHVVPPGSHASSVLDTPALLHSAIDKLCERLAAIAPIDAVLVTGDISDDGSPESYALARDELERLNLPLLVIPGNHDRREELRVAFQDLNGMPAAGLIDWAVDFGDTRIIGLDTLIEGRGAGRLRPESLDFLTQALETPDARSIVVALHHPPLQTGIHFMDAIGLENPDDLSARLLSCIKQTRIVAGHVHGIYHSLIGPHPVSTAPAVCSAFALDLREDAPIGFMTGPTGCAVLDTGSEGLWAAMPLDSANGPFDF
jgi:Icc protein